jgi:sulfatase modifying factor 1
MVGRIAITLGGIFGVGLFLAGGSAPRPAALAVRDVAPSHAAPTNAANAKTIAAPAPLRPRACPDGMVDVEGDYCPNVEQRCLRWLDPATHMRCARFAPTGACSVRTKHEHFCIDRFEYPNVRGTKPKVMVSWNQARATCASEGKRLCGAAEWTLACEGADRLPYPYGYARDANACNIDRPHPAPDEKRLADPRTRTAEVARLDQRVASGANESCVSPFGAYDMTGNVDEWVVNDEGVPHASGLKGGYWGPVRDRCRPMTTAHDERFAYYQIGFRCCADPDAHAPRSSRGAGPRSSA